MASRRFGRGPMSIDTQPFVTIGIAIYKGVDGSIPEALRSALAQTFSDLKVLVCVNGYEDGAVGGFHSPHGLCQLCVAMRGRVVARHLIGRLRTAGVVPRRRAQGS
jgi:hypothetical protein